MSITATRKLEWDAGHRVMRHESKCRHVHGHRYVAEVTVSAPALDDVGRVMDFGEVKQLVGTWIDEHWDHGYMHHPDDAVGQYLESDDQKTFSMPLDTRLNAMEPTAENIAIVLARVAQGLLTSHGRSGLVVERVRIRETPNCWADWNREV